MTNLKKSLSWNVIYLLFILVLGQLDRSDTPIINFAAYFYLTAIMIVPIMIFVPSLHKVSVVVPMTFWGAIYFALFRITERANTGSTNVEVIILELVLLEAGVWLSYQLAVVIEGSQSLMDLLAQGTFPYQALELDDSSEQIKNEFARSRRFHHPLSVVVVHAFNKDEEVAREMLKSLQRDMLTRLSSARIGQAVGEAIRQTDILIKDRFGRYIVLCAETDLEGARLLAGRIARVVEARTGLQVNYGCASFPEEALTFDDLLDLARNRSRTSSLHNDLIGTDVQSVK